MKKNIFLAVSVLSLLVTGCGGEGEAAQEKKVVNVTSVETMDYETGYDYLGIVQAKDTKNYAFLSGGKLEEVYVREGGLVKAGDPLAKLDTSSLEITINTAKTNVNSLKASVATAKSALDAFEVLHASGNLSDKEWESQRSQFITLSGNYDMAVDSLKQAERSLEESTLYAQEDGIVMEVPYEAGEIIGSGYPAVVLKSNQKVVTVGVSAEDIANVTMGSKIEIDGTVSGNIDSIGQYPDEKTRTYPVDIAFESDRYMIGDMVNVKIITGKTSGCFVPVQSIFNVDGLDFVYVVDENGTVVRRQVTQEELKNDQVRVEGVEPGMAVISDGLKNIKENDQVSVLSEEEKAGAEASETIESMNDVSETEEGKS